MNMVFPVGFLAFRIRLHVLVCHRRRYVQVVSEPTEAQLAVNFAPGEPFPTPVLKLTGPDAANPQPIPYYQVSARFVDDNGEVAPVLLDVGRENFDNIIGSSLTNVSGADGLVQWSNAMAIDAVDGCYRMQFLFAPCGGDNDEYRTACPMVENLQTQGYFGGVDATTNILRPVMSAPTTREWCFSNKGVQFSMKGVLSSTTTPGVNLPEAPVMRVTMPYKNEIVVDGGLLVGFLMPYSIKRNSALVLSDNITAFNSLSNALFSAVSGGGCSSRPWFTHCKC